MGDYLPRTYGKSLRCHNLFVHFQEMSIRLLKSVGVRSYTYAAGGKVPEKTKLHINGKFEDSTTTSWIDVCSKN